MWRWGQRAARRTRKHCFSCWYTPWLSKRPQREKKTDNNSDAVQEQQKSDDAHQHRRKAQKRDTNTLFQLVFIHGGYSSTFLLYGYTSKARGPCKGPTALKRSGSRPDRLIICTRLKPVHLGRFALDLDPDCLGRFGRVRARYLGRLGLVRARCLGRLTPGLKLDSPGRFAPVPKRSAALDGSHQA